MCINIFIFFKYLQNLDQALFFIQLEKYTVDSVNETTISLKIENKPSPNASLNEPNANETRETLNANLNIKNKLKLFEVNYELKFNSTDFRYNKQFVNDYL